MPPKNQAKACSVTGGATLQERGNAAYLREAYMNTHNKEDHAFQSNRQNTSYKSLHACLNAVVHDKNSQNYYSPSSKLCNKLLNAKNREAIDSIMQSETPRYYKLEDYDAAKKAVAIATPFASPRISPVSFPDSGGGGGGGGSRMASPVEGSSVLKPIAKPTPPVATFGVPESTLAAGSTTITKAKRNVRSPRLQRSPRRSVHRMVRRSRSPKASPKRPRGTIRPVRRRRRDRNDNSK